MKKVLLISFLFIAKMSLAQSYIPMNFDTSSVWVHLARVYINSSPPAYGYGETVSYVEKDTVINNKIYFKINMYMTYNSGPPAFFVPIQSIKTTDYFREDTALRRVYKLINGVDSTVIDFNAKVGDTIYWGTEHYNSSRYLCVLFNKVYSIDSIITIPTEYGINRRAQYWMHDLYNGQISAHSIEGVGLHYQFPFDEFGGEWDLPGHICQCYKQHDSVKYFNPQDISFIKDSCYKKPIMPLSNRDFEKYKDLLIYSNGEKIIINNTNRKSMKIKLLSITGAVLFEDHFEALDYRRDLQGLSSGLYFLYWENERYNGTEKIWVP